MLEGDQTAGGGSPKHGLGAPKGWGLCSETGPHAPAGLKMDPSELAAQQLLMQMLCQLLMQLQSDAALLAAVGPWATAESIVFIKPKDQNTWPSLWLCE